MSYIRNYRGTEYSNITESQLSNIFSTNLWNTTVEVHFHDIQNCRIAKDITGEGAEQKTNWLLIWNEGVTRKTSAYISIKFNNANENCAKSCKCYYDGSLIEHNHEAYIVGNTIVFGDQCYTSNYGGRCNMPLTNVEYEFVENKDVLWQDFTQTKLKEWADNQGITSDTTLTAEQKASLEAKIGCAINGDINYKAGNEPYLSGSLTFVFSNAVKTKAKQNDNTVITGTSFAVTASDVKEINHGDVILNGAYLWENYHNMNTYINKTDINISNTVTTSYQRQYDSTYLTKLAKYGGGNKQLEFLTNAKHANETESKTTSGHYYFNSPQNYGGGNSDKYQYWATKGNSNIQVITTNSKLQRITQEDDTHCTIYSSNNVISFIKKPNAKVYVLKREGCTTFSRNEHMTIYARDVKHSVDTDQATPRIGVVIGHTGSGTSDDFVNVYPFFNQGSYPEDLKLSITGSQIFFSSVDSNNWQTYDADWTDISSFGFGEVVTTTYTKTHSYIWQEMSPSSGLYYTTIYADWLFMYGSMQKTINAPMALINNSSRINTEVSITLKNWRINNSNIWNDNEGNITLSRNDNVIINYDSFNSTKSLFVNKTVLLDSPNGGILKTSLQIDREWDSVYNYEYRVSPYIPTFYGFMGYDYEYILTRNDTSNAYAVIVYNPD